MGPRFTGLVLLPGGDLKVSGEFETHRDVIDDVVIRFLMIPDGIPAALTAPIVGTATIANDDLSRPDPGCDITHGLFNATFPNSFGLAAGAIVRGIGLSVAIKGADPPDPPAYETFTWCVNLVVT
jgi:hypothetical protein